MKKIALLLAALCAVILSCQKTVPVPLSYSVENTAGNPLADVYVPDAGTYDLAAWVKFLTGSSTDNVTLIFKGLPADVVPEHDTISGIPTYTAHFILHTNHAVQAKYAVSIVSKAIGSEQKTYNFNLTVIPADCAAYLLGDFTSTNVCTARSYGYTATASATGTANTLNISNFGGYGITTNVRVNINCDNDSLSIPSQNNGAGTTIQGYGVFTTNKMTFWYSATNTPAGTSETCIANLTK